jgi:putative intracellular protease/amidase
MNATSAAAPARVLILVAHGFEEEFTVCCLSRMREAGLNVSLVGFSAGLIGSLHGLQMRPDLSLEKAMAEQPAEMVVLPGGTYAVSALLTDPRVHRMLKATWTAGGIIAASHVAQSVLTKQGLLPEQMLSCMHVQQELNATEFAQQLITLLL